MPKNEARMFDGSSCIICRYGRGSRVVYFIFQTAATYLIMSFVGIRRENIESTLRTCTVSDQNVLKKVPYIFHPPDGARTVFSFFPNAIIPQIFRNAWLKNIFSKVENSQRSSLITLAFRSFFRADRETRVRYKTSTVELIFILYRSRFLFNRSRNDRIN